mgnify:CR=1 FL=1
MNNAYVYVSEASEPSRFEEEEGKAEGVVLPDGLCMPLSVRSSEARKGRQGAFMVYPAKAGDVIGWFRGCVVEAEVAPSERCIFRPSTGEADDLNSPDLPGVWLDGTRGGNALQFVVDRYQPPVRQRTEKPDSVALRPRDCAIVALCDLEPRDELVMRYGKRRWMPHRVAGAVPCGVESSPSCHGSAVAPGKLRGVHGGPHTGKVACMACALRENREHGVWRRR